MKKITVNTKAGPKSDSIEGNGGITGGLTVGVDGILLGPPRSIETI